jgi:large subunit ribosomal protein L3
MNLCILGTKLGMTQVFDSSGLVIPVTIIKAGPCIITQVKTHAKEGYDALQIGYLPVKKNLLSQAVIGHFAKTNTSPMKYIREFRVDSGATDVLGSVLSVGKFSLGDIVSVSGKTIGKGFAGTVKRHNFTRGPMTHGSKNHREPGSIGMGTTPGRVYPGKKMAGRLGGKQATVKNLAVILINESENLLVLKGSVPGKKGSLLTVKKITK